MLRRTDSLGTTNTPFRQHLVFSPSSYWSQLLFSEGDLVEVKDCFTTPMIVDRETSSLMQLLEGGHLFYEDISGLEKPEDSLILTPWGVMWGFTIQCSSSHYLLRNNI